MKVYENISQLVGKTPLLHLSAYEKAQSISASIYAKLEYFNPAGSVKDRVARKMIEDAETTGALKPGATIVEPTSGNTGIGLAAIAAAKGYKAIFTMPETMSIERQKLLKAYGAEVVLTEGSKGMSGAISKAKELAKELPLSFMPSQFENMSNPKAHLETTGPEIWEDTDGKIDIFVAGIGTGGTVSGTGQYLKSKNPKIKVVAVEPSSSPVLSGGKPGPHKIQGIGAGFIPAILDTDIYDEVIPIDNEVAMETARQVATKSGALVGISSGAALAAATILGKREENSGKNIVVLMPDTGEHYLSTELYSK